ncbi:TetR/AcrR family transcriptional regulator [Natrononativus amylolyticus]|uniref:TetR/AcrR family transcriptional regulator n=1 Tax=Natrononativus amylolyticus TaxID=2963434 RepID=UPI0020CED134|nr:TetR/AcrR family transcriptional regulator [Natrononativus amylolyticus]
MHGFSDEERDRIREDLLEVGREKVLAFGLKKTNVADITEPVGIAKSSFYLFFDSKAELYLEIMRHEVDEFTESLDNELDGVDDPREGFERLCWCYKAFVENNPLVQQLFREDDYRMFRDTVPPERLAEIAQEGVSEIVPYIEFFQERSDGLLAERDPVTILGMVGTIELLALHREDYEEYDEDYYEQVQELLITTLATGLTADRPSD